MSVPIQPGNSGGPVVNEQGFVVGIVAATASVETFFRATGILPQSVNWAVNADFARTLFDAPKTKGVVPKTRQEAIDLAQKAICYVMQME
jgi:S1-C subfamily serine protease